MSSSADPELLTMEEALAEVPPARTLVWGAGMGPLTWSLPEGTAVRYAGLDAGDGRGVSVSYEATLDPQILDETRLVCRMPRSKEGLAWMLDLARARLPVGGELWLGGHVREGIRSATKPMEAAIGPVVTARTKRHGRVLLARKRAGEQAPALLDSHAERFDVPFGPTTLKCVTYPETFAHGRLDEGDAAPAGLARARPPRQEDPRSRLRRRHHRVGPGDPRQRQSDPGGRLGLGDALGRSDDARQRDRGRHGHAGRRRRRPPAAPFDLVITNPPFHEGREQDRGIARRFAAVAASRLTGTGRFIAVANRHLGYREDLALHFRKVDVAWEDERYRIWCCTGPRAPITP
jgi:16S rRNA (guanine1207-N2)-methyltransferase